MCEREWRSHPAVDSRSRTSQQEHLLTKGDIYRGSTTSPVDRLIVHDKGGSDASDGCEQKGGFHAAAMGTLNELCVSSLQTFLCPAVEALQQDPRGKVKSDMSAFFII